MSLRKLVTVTVTKANPNESEEEAKKRETRVVALSHGSDVVFIPRFISFDQASKWFDYLDTQIPWIRPTVRVFGRSCLQPRDTCYVASPGLPDLVYSGYQPQAYSWDDFPPLKEILEAVHKALPGSIFNSLLLNRYKGGNDYVAWHADDEKVYGPTPEIASVSFGCEREFFLKKKPAKTSKVPGTSLAQELSLLTGTLVGIVVSLHTNYAVNDALEARMVLVTQMKINSISSPAQGDLSF